VCELLWVPLCEPPKPPREMIPELTCPVRGSPILARPAASEGEISRPPLTTLPLL